MSRAPSWGLAPATPGEFAKVVLARAALEPPRKARREGPLDSDEVLSWGGWSDERGALVLSMNLTDDEPVRASYAEHRL